LAPRCSSIVSAMEWLSDPTAIAIGILFVILEFSENKPRH
jgi:hypothetical protein